MKNLPLLLILAAMLCISAVTVNSIKPAAPKAIECHYLRSWDIDPFLKNKTKHNWILKTMAYDRGRGRMIVVIEKY